MQALAHPGPSTIGVPEQKVAAMLEARRLPRGWVGKVIGRIYRECLTLVQPRISFRHIPACSRVHLDPLANSEGEGMWLATRLCKGAAAEALGEESYIIDSLVRGQLQECAL